MRSFGSLGVLVDTYRYLYEVKREERGCSCACAYSPALSGPDDGESHDGTDDEESHYGHDAIKIPPPPGTFVSRLVHEPELMGVIDGAESTLGLVRLYHLMFWVRG